jgi:hypothetical protein
MIDEFRYAVPATIRHKQMNMIGCEFYCLNQYTQLMRLASHQRFYQFPHWPYPKYRPPVFRGELQMVVATTCAVPIIDYLHFIPPKVFDKLRYP